MSVGPFCMLGAAVALAACSPKADPTASAADATLPNAAVVPAGPIASTGRITAIDAAAGTVTIAHQPIPAIGWGAMTMRFTATDATLLNDLKVDDAVSFELKSAAEKTLITKIEKQ